MLNEGKTGTSPRTFAFRNKSCDRPLSAKKMKLAGFKQASEGRGRLDREGEENLKNSNNSKY